MQKIKHRVIQLILGFLCMGLIACSSSDQSGHGRSKTGTRDHVTIAILMPTTGPETTSGQEYINMIKQGLADGAKIPVQIKVYDSATPEILENSLGEIVDNGTDIIIGPIYTQPTKITADKIKGTNIVAFSLSNNPSLASNQIYVFGHAPMRQLQQLIKYTLENGYSDYITLLPEGNWSEKTNEIIESVVRDKKQHFVLANYYQNNDIDDIIAKIKNISYKVDELNENADNYHKPVVILADDNQHLTKLLSVLKFYQLDKKAVLLGDNRLNFNTRNNVDIIYTGSIDLINSNFLKKAADQNIKDVSFMHILAYDAGKMIGSYIGKGYNRNQFLSDVNSKTFDAFSGEIYFTDYIAQRKYNIIQRKNGKFTNL